MAIAATPRSGSTLLATGLGATGRLGEPDEHLNRATVAPLPGPLWSAPRVRLGRALRAVHRRVRPDPRREVIHLDRDSAERYLWTVAERSASADGVLSMKVMWRQLDVIVLAHDLDLDLWRAPLTWIRICRIDRVAQAVSASIAMQTDRWRADEARSSHRHARYASDHIQQRLRDIEQQEAGWDRYFGDRSITPIEVTYEDLDAHYEATMAAVLVELGLEGTPVPPRQLTRQGDARNVEWAQRFRAEQGPSPGSA
ncbi:MAG: Stf0 family sulfotransferase [Acidimicrobiales bacterium]